MSSRSRTPNLTNVLVYVGCAALVMTLWLPGASADRAARVETRAEEAGRALLQTALAAEPLDFRNGDQVASFEAAFRDACIAVGHPNSYLPTLRVKPQEFEDVDGLCFETKHYCYLVARGLPTDRASRRLPLEVYVWPQDLRPPGHTAFFFPESGAAAFTRNLVHQYVGWEEDRAKGRCLPRPGDGVPRRASENRDYRGRDDERWILLR